jgi:hypothetical protein
VSMRATYGPRRESTHSMRSGMKMSTDLSFSGTMIGTNVGVATSASAIWSIAVDFTAPGGAAISSSRSIARPAAKLSAVTSPPRSWPWIARLTRSVARGSLQTLELCQIGRRCRPNLSVAAFRRRIGSGRQPPPTAMPDTISPLPLSAIAWRGNALLLAGFVSRKSVLCKPSIVGAS